MNNPAAAEIFGEEEIEKIPEGHHLFAIMDRTGDTKITFDPRNEDEVEIAKKQFADLRKKGFNAYKVQPKDGSKGELVREFDAREAMYIFVPPMQGG
jgi:hypothetical protein